MWFYSRYYNWLLFIAYLTFSFSSEDGIAREFGNKVIQNFINDTDLFFMFDHISIFLKALLLFYCLIEKITLPRNVRSGTVIWNSETFIWISDTVILYLASNMLQMWPLYMTGPGEYVRKWGKMFIIYVYQKHNVTVEGLVWLFLRHLYPRKKA